MDVRCGFGPPTREYDKDGKTMVINDLRLYKIESVRKAQQTGGGGAAAAVPQHPEEQAAPAMSPQQQGGQFEDDLPF